MIQSRNQWPLLAALLTLTLTLSRACVSLSAAPADTEAPTRPSAAVAAEPFLGRWDLTIREGNREFPSWLELTIENGSVQSRFVGRWGHARRLPSVEIHSDELIFVSPKEEEGSKTDLTFRGTRKGVNLQGTAEGPEGARWTWAGKRAPELPAPDSPKWGELIVLFNGRDFTGWHFDNPAKAASWKVENDCLVNSASGANIVTDQKFQDFKLHIEVNCPAHANSGIYLRGRYELQVEDDSIEEPANHHMGAIYGFLTPTPERPRQPGEWQRFDITLLGRFVTVVQNGHTIIDNQEIPGITGGALDSHEELPGPIYLQGDHGGITFRNIRLTPSL